MSLLPLVANSWAFSERPIEVYEIQDLYSPFSQMTNEDPESLADALERSQLLYLIEGTRGDGKSCFLRFLASSLYGSDVFTILLDTFGNADYSDPNTMAKWVIGAISRAIEIYDKVEDKTKKYVSELMARKVTFEKGSESSFSSKIGGWFSIIPQILRIEASAGAEIKRIANTIIEKEYFLDDRVACVNDLIDTITAETGFSNVTMLIDGVDHMNVVDVAQFAKNNFPWLTKVRASICLTALSKYRENAGYAAISECARIVKIPRIASVNGLKIFLNRRISALDPNVTWDNVCHEDATKLLFYWYNSKPELITLRTTLRSLNYAADKALHDGADQILPYHMAIGIKDSF